MRKEDCTRCGGKSAARELALAAEIRAGKEKSKAPETQLALNEVPAM